MKILNRAAMLTVTAMLGTGCVQESAPTVEYFRAQRDERVAQLQHCTNDAAGSKNDPFCVNAREAERLESVGRLRDLPPVGLVPVRPPAENAGQKSHQQD